MIGEKDADMPMHLDVQARNKKDAESAEKLCKDLVETVNQEYEKFKNQPAPQGPPVGMGAGPYGGGNFGGESPLLCAPPLAARAPALVAVLQRS